MASFFAVGLVGLAFIAALIGFAALNAWALQILWGWFLVPGLGFQPIEFVTAMGISLIVSFMVAKPNFSKSQSSGGYEEALGVFVYLLVAPFMVLGFGWLYLSLFG